MDAGRGLGVDAVQTGVRAHRSVGAGRLAVLLVAALLAALLGLTVGRASADVTTVSTDTLRTGWDSHEPGLGQSSVQASDFGQLFSTQLDGQIYAQPLSVNGTLIANTETDKVYGLDPVNGTVKWTRDLGPTWPSSAINCGDLAPNVGSTSTAVYDPATNAVYLTTKVNDGVDNLHPHWYMHALDPATGAEKTGFPVTIAGTPTNDPTGTAFDPTARGSAPACCCSTAWSTRPSARTATSARTAATWSASAPPRPCRPRCGRARSAPATRAAASGSPAAA